jgi:hypothetical protein
MPSDAFAMIVSIHAKALAVRQDRLLKRGEARVQQLETSSPL